jgi:hypothetical protein
MSKYKHKCFSCKYFKSTKAPYGICKKQYDKEIASYYDACIFFKLKQKGK